MILKIKLLNVIPREFKVENMMNMTFLIFKFEEIYLLNSYSVSFKFFLWYMFFFGLLLSHLLTSISFPYC